MKASTALGSCRARCSPLKRATAWLKPKSSRPAKETAATRATQSPKRAWPRARRTTGVVITVATTPAASAANPLSAPAPTRGALTSGADADALSEESGEPLNHKLQHLLRQPWKNADEKRVAHHAVGLRQLARNPHRRIDIAGLPEDVAREDVTGLDIRVLQPLHQRAA